MPVHLADRYIFRGAFCLAEFPPLSDSEPVCLAISPAALSLFTFLIPSVRPSNRRCCLPFFLCCFNSQSEAFLLLFTFRRRIYIYVNPSRIREFSRGNDGKLKSIGFGYRGCRERCSGLASSADSVFVTSSPVVRGSHPPTRKQTHPLYALAARSTEDSYRRS